MNVKPYKVSERDCIVTLTLDTPGSEVNILSNDAAAQVLDVLAGVHRGSTRAVVFASAKEASFINGVGLLMAIAARSPESAQALTGRVRAAYDAVRECPVPTIAAVRGNCYGCGVEFSLCCDHRVAADTVSTHFYMTELNDYLFSPVFEGTLRLPLLLELEAAIDLMLWGQRWTARQALSRGLVERVIDHREFNAGVEAFVDGVAAREGQAPPLHRSAAGLTTRDQQVIRENLDRIGRLPPAYQDVYRDCLWLMAHVKREGRVTDAARRRELFLAGSSSCRRKAKNAFSFFFIRQMARRIARGDPPPARRRRTLSVDLSSDAALALWSDLARRPLPDVDVVAGTDSQPGVPPPDFLLSDNGATDAGPREIPVATPVKLQLASLGRPPVSRSPIMLHGPAYPTGPLLFELAMTNGISNPARELYETLTRAGFEVVLTRPKDSFVLDSWLQAYLQPLLAYCLGGGSASDLNATLRRFGFVRRPHAVLEHYPTSVLLPLLRQAPVGSPGRVLDALEALRAPAYEYGTFDRRVVDGLLVCLLAAAVQCLDEGSLLHPSQADLVAREAFDFPLRFGSLCRFATPRRIEAVLYRRPTFRDLVPPASLARVEEYVERGRPFYL